MLEELVTHAIYDGCVKVYEDKPEIRFKKWHGPSDPLSQFYYNASLRTRFDMLPRLDGRSGIWKKDSLMRKAWLFFNENAEAIFDGYVRDRFDGNLLMGMRNMGHYNKLREDYTEYFGERRKKHLEKESKEIEIARGALSGRMKAPQSHGGVANLLKVLTKTMVEQGSSIQSIAKVQYAVCVQAGIALPTEFLTDVLVAEEIIHGN